MRGHLPWPSKSVALISLILEQYKGVFERIYVNTEREQAYWDEWDESALRRIIQQQRKITEASKKLEMKKLYQVLVVIDDFADTPQLHKPHGALDTLFMQISTWVSSQKLRLISAAVRVNMQFLCCWRLRNQHELDAVIEELSALLPKEQLYRLYEQATREPYSFLFVYHLKPKNEMFYKRFEERFALEKDADGSGAQKLFLKKRMTTIYVDSRKRVAGSDSDFEVDLGESLHLQSDARLAVYKIRLADSFLSTDRGRYLYWLTPRWAR